MFIDAVITFGYIVLCLILGLLLFYVSSKILLNSGKVGAFLFGIAVCLLPYIAYLSNKYPSWPEFKSFLESIF